MKKTRTQGLHMLREVKQRDSNLSKGWGQFVTPPSVRTKRRNQQLNN